MGTNTMCTCEDSCNNLLAFSYNKMLKSDGDYKLRTFHNDSGKEIPHFPKTTRAFWFLDCEAVESLLNDLRIDYSQCQTKDDRLRELGMHIGVHPDSNPKQKTIDKIHKQIYELQEHATELKTDVAELKTDVAELKTDVAELKNDVTELKTDVAELKNEVKKDFVSVIGELTTIKASINKLLRHFDISN